MLATRPRECSGIRLSTKIRIKLQPKGQASDLALKMRADGLTYLSEQKFARLEQCLTDVERKGVLGDIAEFGIALGGSGIVLARHAQKHDRCFFGFDVFGMIPEPASEKDDAKSKERYETISSGQSKGIRGGAYYGYVDDLYAQVSASFAANQVAVDGKRIHLVKGLFEETVPTADLGKLAFCHLDCDWYDPVHFCLNVVADKLSPGGIILLDDYHDYGGCQTAVDEFRMSRKDFRFEDGRNVILRKQD